MSSTRHYSALDRLIMDAQRGLGAAIGSAVAVRANPGAPEPDIELDPTARRHAAGLMRVNHTGEVCAQALYSAQAMVTRDPEIGARFAQAAREEEDHLAWTQQRLDELSSRRVRMGGYFLKAC